MQNEKIKQILATPLPKEALKKHPSRSYLTTINPIYVVGRLNQAFEIGGWKFTTEVIETSDKFVVVRGLLEVPEHGIVVENYGGNDNTDRGDAYKGAATDALTKCASYLGIGAEVWRDGKPAEQVKTAEDEKNIRAEFEKKIKGKVKQVDSWLKSKTMIEPKESYRDLPLNLIDDFLANWEAFQKQIDKKNESPQNKTTK
jgi:hypothetical protein